jgi:hypothetical protein
MRPCHSAVCTAGRACTITSAQPSSRSVARAVQVSAAEISPGAQAAICIA